MTARRQIALGLLFLPVRLIAMLVGIVWMVLTVPLLFTVIVLILAPAEAAWICSPFVGLISPRAGHRLASFMEPAIERFDAAISFFWSPVGWLGDVALR